MAKIKIQEAPFRGLCDLIEELEGISKGSSAIPKRRLYTRSISRWFDRFSGGDVYLAFRLLVPEIDLDRVYYMKEKTLAGILASELGLANTRRGQQLESWRVDSRLGKSQGDLGTVLHTIIRGSEISSVPTVTIAELNAQLDAITTCKQMNGGFIVFDRSRGSPLVGILFKRLTSIEMKWAVRIILKDLRLNIEPRVFMDAFHGWLWKIFSTRNDLKLACNTSLEMIKKGYASCAKVSDAEFRRICDEFFKPQIGTNIAIMACGRAQGLQHVAERLAGHKCFVETKFDGERLQVHISKSWPERVRIFSKSGRNSTNDRYRCHEQLLKALKFTDSQNIIESCIVEGELLVFDEAKGQIENFGTVQDLHAWKSAYRGDIVSGRRHYLVILFDLLHLNGQDLTSKPLSFRRALLDTLVVVKPNYVELSEYTAVDFSLPKGLDILHTLFTEALASRMEGLIIKKSNSRYISGNRSEWLKLKKDYISGFGDTAEFAVVGLSYGNGSEGLLDTMIIGVLTNKAELEQDEGVWPRFLLVFEVSQGLNEDERKLFHEKALSMNLIKTTEPCTTFDYEFATGYRTHVDFIVPQPIIAELLGSGFVKERGQPHHVLRFPRIQKVYFNRPVTDSLSFQELQDMAAASFTPDLINGKEVSEALAKHTEDHVVRGKRAPQMMRPNRLSFEQGSTESLESPSKLLCTMTLASPLDQLRKDYFIHIPADLEGHEDYIKRIEELGIETLHHLIAVAQCENRKCIVVEPPCGLDTIRQSLRYSIMIGPLDPLIVSREMCALRQVFSLKLPEFQLLLDDIESFRMSMLGRL